MDDETAVAPPLDLVDEIGETLQTPPDPPAVAEGERASAAIIAKMAAVDAGTKTVVLVHTSPFLVLPPHLPAARKFYPLHPVELPAQQADALMAEGLGVTFRLAEPGDQPSAAHRRLIRSDRHGHRCCGG